MGAINVDNLVSQALIQAPLFVIMLVFLWQLEKLRQKGIEANHHEWRTWLGHREETDRLWKTQQDSIWREFISRLNTENREERQQLISIIERLDNNITRLNNITLMVYATLSGDRDKANKMEKMLVEELER